MRRLGDGVGRRPNAMGFYERMGAVRVGVTASSVVPGRELPRMRVPLEE